MAATISSPKPEQPPPPTSVGVIGWLHHHLFYSWFSTVATLVGAYLLYTAVAAIYDWAIANAVWTAGSRRECLDISPDGACWAGVKVWFKAFLYGRYPPAEQWRVNLAFVVLVLWLLPLWLPRVSAKIGMGITAVVMYPFLASYLFVGGERDTLAQFAWCLAATAFIGTLLHTGLSLLTGTGLRGWWLLLTGFVRRPETQHKYILTVGVVGLFGLVYWVLGDWQAVTVKTHLWGGLFLTLTIAGIGIVVALPAGVMLALARRSTMPVIRVAATAFIELFRSVPLITILFMAVTMMPLFLPAEIQLNKLTQVIIGVCLFAAAYMAEIVRGGLQAIPYGQYEAAKALGLGYWKSMGLVVIPQALKLMIPNIVGNFIGLLKDTTLVSIIGLYDFLLMLRAAGSDPLWNGLYKEPLVCGAVVFFVLCFAMSRYSQYLERKWGQKGCD